MYWFEFAALVLVLLAVAIFLWLKWRADAIRIGRALQDSAMNKNPEERTDEDMSWCSMDPYDFTALVKFMETMKQSDLQSEMKKLAVRAKWARVAVFILGAAFVFMVVAPIYLFVI